MTIFTDAGAAIDEAMFLANQEDRAYAVAVNKKALVVVRPSTARDRGYRILEICSPPAWEDAA